MMDAGLIQAARELLPEGEIYCDWAASALALPPCKPTFIPPHHASTVATERARAAVRKFLKDTEEKYHVIFTAGTTSSFQLLAHRVPWSHNDVFICHRHVHNSVLGIRNVAVHAGARFVSVSTRDVFSTLRSEAKASSGFAVFVYPGECNLTGAVYPLSWAQRAKSEGMLGYPGGKVITIVDTAKLIANTPLSLDEHPYIDALTFSLYKLSSTYTGLGVLLIRKKTLLEEVLHSSGTSSYFGGQSSDVITPFSTTLHVPSPFLERALSSGTPNLQAIHALPEQLGHMTNMLEMHVRAYTIGVLFRRLLLEAFSDCKIYGDDLVSVNCATTSFTLFRRGCPVGHHEIGTMLSLNGVHIRVGTMCNISATAVVLGLSDKDLVALHRRGYRCGEGADVVDGRATGVVRVSFGWGSVAEDARTVIRVLQELVGGSVKMGVPTVEQRREVRRLFVYPVKGCGGVEVDGVSCIGGGFKGDRMFGVIDKWTGNVLDVKKCARLAEIECWYDVDADGKEVLRLRFRKDEVGMDIKVMKGDADADGSSTEGDSCNVDWRSVSEIGDEEIEEWLSSVLHRRVGFGVLHVRKRDVLVVTEEEVRQLGKESGMEDDAIIRAIRPNLVVFGGGVSAELVSLMGCVEFTRVRRCTRCKAVNINSGLGNGQPLLSIARLCRRNGGGGLVFGCIMTLGRGFLKVHDPIW